MLKISKLALLQLLVATKIETFVQIRELARTMQSAVQAEDEKQKKSLMQKSGELIGDILGSQFEIVGSETEVELNFAMVKIRHKGHPWQ